ncbi:hypothetical protein AAC03nite_20410 [Alicyclobacillus acidoterrestris]|uniref:sigma factor-like helix-turn-helix DNA-binding protein n=1 Tax=Alicyclobacillus suci TaxID=2816080 RepID=UPI0011939420|nr:sigma factor-like helix-turn-helix DNA-binding protein [Alicyclobacillus suci]GEO26256.1 hypothetical protein AAC03nite_20410 [Alicyclobacillus acidoterrestris]
MLADVIARVERTTDETYERVFAALRYWMQDGTLKPTQAEAIYLHAVELFTYEEIADMVGLHYSTVMHHYKNGIERLKARYDQEMVDVAV